MFFVFSIFYFFLFFFFFSSRRRHTRLQGDWSSDVCSSDLGKQGITVVLGSRDAKKGEAASETLRNEGIAAESLGFDVTKTQDHQQAYDYFAKEYGRLDILVN